MYKGITLLFAAVLLTAACQPKPSADEASSPATGSNVQEIRPSGEASKASNHDAQADTKAADNARDALAQAEDAERDDAAAAVQSQDILARPIGTDYADVQHVLISWSDLSPVYARRGGQDARGAARSKIEADKLALSILQKTQNGENFNALMRKYSEDPGSAKSGQSYPVTPDASLVEPFKDLSLRLKPEEAGVVESSFGYHIIYRIQ